MDKVGHMAVSHPIYDVANGSTDNQRDAKPRRIPGKRDAWIKPQQRTDDAYRQHQKQITGLRQDAKSGPGVITMRKLEIITQCRIGSTVS